MKIFIILNEFDDDQSKDTHTQTDKRTNLIVRFINKILLYSIES